MKKIAYIMLIMAYQSGVTAKIQRLASTAKANNIKIDYYWFTSKKYEKDKSTENVKIKFSKYNNPVFIRIWQAKEINRLSKQYYKIIIRYPLYDPFLDILIKEKGKIYTEHHTKEVEELRLLKSIRYITERFIGNKWLKKFNGIIGVTEEIKDYELQRLKVNIPSIFIPNSIPTDINKQYRNHVIGENFPINIIFVANFRPWHGLENVLKALKTHMELQDQFRIHIVGKVSEDLNRELNKFSNVTLHGELKNDKINHLYNKMDFAIGGLNLDLNRMKETTSLKVREYFNFGLPVIIGCTDPAFPKNFKYLVYSKQFDLNKIFTFIKENAGLSTDDVRIESKNFISSEVILKRLYKFCCDN